MCRSLTSPLPACHAHHHAHHHAHTRAQHAQYEKIAAEIEQVDGVVTHGLLLGVADAVVVADASSGVRVLQKQDQAAAAAAAAPAS